MSTVATERESVRCNLDLPTFTHALGPDRDKNIPAKALAFMAERAGSQRPVVVEGASHVVMISQPRIVAALIEEAAR